MQTLSIDSHALVERLLHPMDGQRRLWLDRWRRAVDHGWELLCEWPRPWSGVVQAEIGPRLYWLQLPSGYPRHWTSIISSRGERRLTESAAWVRQLEAALHGAQSDETCVVFVRQTLIGEALEHALSRYAIQRVEWLLPDARMSMTEWFTAELTRATDASCHPSLSISPLCPSSLHPSTDDTPYQTIAATHLVTRKRNHSQMQLADRCLVSLPDRVHALHLRPKGKLTRLLQRRLVHPDYPTASIRIGIPAYKTDNKDLDRENYHRLLEHGAVGWLASSTVDDDCHSVTPSEWLVRRLIHSNHSQPATVAPILHRPLSWLEELESTDWPYLTHCTRARQGAWPDQSWSQYRDELLIAGGAEPHAPLVTLARIVQHQRLVATDWLRQGGQRTVCFSQVPLTQLLARRCFRSHVGRWDWEPYGICIRRGWLENQGARPVTYIERDRWKDLPPHAKWFAQPIDTTPTAYAQPIDTTGTAYAQPADRTRTSYADWSIEREWRIMDDLRLGTLAFSDAFLFVPTYSEAKIIAAISRWPVLSLTDSH